MPLGAEWLGAGSETFGARGRYRGRGLNLREEDAALLSRMEHETIRGMSAGVGT
jgi:hypothetical protein